VRQHITRNKQEDEMSRNRSLTRAIVLVATGAVAALGAVSASAGGGKSPSIAGAWMVDVDRGPTLPPLKSLQTYTGSQTVVEIANGGAAARSPSHGAWQHVAGRTYASTVVFFRYDPASGAYAGTVKIRHTIELSADSRSFTGIAVAELRDPAGNIVPMPARRDVLRGVRIDVEPVLASSALDGQSPVAPLREAGALDLPWTGNPGYVDDPNIGFGLDADGRDVDISR
jgi:hypothetical protein